MRESPGLTVFVSMTLRDPTSRYANVWVSLALAFAVCQDLRFHLRGIEREKDEMNVNTKPLFIIPGSYLFANHFILFHALSDLKRCRQDKKERKKSPFHPNVYY